MNTQNLFQESMLAWMRRIEARLIAAEQQKTVVLPKTPENSDTCNFVQALQFLNEKGYTLSKSSLYKLTSAKEIPHKRFKSRLVFSRKDLMQWLESQTVNTNMSSEATLQLARSANRKGKKGGTR